MTQDEIIRMAREAGCYEKYEVCYFVQEDLERFAALVAAHWQKIHEQEMSMMSELCADRILEEREACAKVCEERLMTHPIKDDVNDAYQLAVKGCAAAIRGMK